MSQPLFPVVQVPEFRESICYQTVICLYLSEIQCQRGFIFSFHSLAQNLCQLSRARVSVKSFHGGVPDGTQRQVILSETAQTVW